MCSSFSLIVLFYFHLLLVVAEEGWIVAHLNFVKKVEICHIATAGGVEQHRPELVAPQDFLRRVGGAALTGGRRRLHGGVEGNEELKVSCVQVFGRQSCQWALLIQNVVEAERQDEEGTLPTGVHVEVNRSLVDLSLLALLGGVGLEQLSCELALDQQAPPHVGHSHHQTQLALAFADHCVVAELDGFCSLFGSSQFGQKGSRDEDLGQAGDDQLSHESEDSQRTLLGDVTKTVANGGLRLQREQEGSGESLHVHHARRVVGVRQSVKVSVPHADEEIEDPEDKPGHDEGGGKQGQLVAPLHVHHCGPDVMQVQLDHALHVVDPDVVVAVLGHNSSLDF